MKVHHIGYAVANIEKATKKFMDLGFIVCGTEVFDIERQVNILFMKNGEYCIELISPPKEVEMSSASPVNQTLEKCGPTPYHICYEVENLEESMALLKKQRYICVENPAFAPAIAEDAVVAFMYNSSIGLIELVSLNKR